MSQALTYTLFVNGSVYGSQSARNAYRFACAVIEKGHTLVNVFFYQEGVLNASSITSPANDEFDLVKAWQRLSIENNVKLETCVAAGLRRGIISKDEAQQHQLLTDNVADEFSQAGLGSLAQALLLHDRVVQF